MHFWARELGRSLKECALRTWCLFDRNDSVVLIDSCKVYVSPVANLVVFVHSLHLNIFHGIILKTAVYVACISDRLLSANAVVCMYSCEYIAACSCVGLCT